MNGSTIQVVIDSVPIGTATYNNFRPDVSQAFPGLNNSNGPVGFLTFDTRVLANGMHTIEWRVTDNQGVSEGLGSRFFEVLNGSAASVSASAEARLGALTAARSRWRPRQRACGAG